VLHIDLAHWADTVLVAPATINTIAKLVNGITDNLVMSIIRAFKGTIYIAPAMNTQMYLNGNPFLKKLNDFNVHVIDPQEKVLACGDFGMGGLANKRTIVETVVTPMFPVKLNYLGFTSDSDSFKLIKVGVDIEIPLENHVGGYGYIRTHHSHEGIDLYTYEGEPVYACESGNLISSGHFTGVGAATPWWCDTQYVAVNSSHCINLYGEIKIANELMHASHGDSIKKGQLIGYVKRVLRNDKGRPTSMLHFEQHSNKSTILWDNEYIYRPLNTINPTGYLIATVKRQWQI
jgi:hypothetical protein